MKPITYLFVLCVLTSFVVAEGIVISQQDTTAAGKSMLMAKCKASGGEWSQANNGCVCPEDSVGWKDNFGCDYVMQEVRISTTELVKLREAQNAEEVEDVLEDAEPATTTVSELTQNKVVGLQNALVQMKTEQQKTHIQEVIQKIEAKRLEQLNKLEELKIAEEDGVVTAVGKVKEAKLFGFLKTGKKVKYTLENNGEVTRVKSMLDRLYKMPVEEE